MRHRSARHASRPGPACRSRASPTRAAPAVRWSRWTSAARRRPAAAVAAAAHAAAARARTRPLVLLFPVTYRVNAAGHMEVGGCDLVDLAQKHGTPLYVYDEATIRQRSAEYVAAMDGAGEV